MQMYNVSLLPKEYRMIHTNTRRKNIALVASMIIMAVLFVVYLILAIVLSGKRAELDGLKAQNSAMRVQINSLAELKTLNEEVTLNLADVNKAIGTSPDWDKLIVQIGNTAPPTISVQNYSIEYEPETNIGIGSITGTAANYDTVSLWLVTLKEVEDISNITFKYSSKTSDDENSLVGFEINFIVNEGPGYTLPLEVIVNE